MTSVEICGEGHELSFFCSSCNRLFCGKCCTNTHSRKGGFKEHDVEPIEDRLTIENHKRQQLIEELKQLSERVEAAANANDAIADESREVLSGFVAEVERFLMSAQRTRDTQCLRRLRRECIALLQRDVSARRSADPEARPADALVSVRSLNSDSRETTQQHQEVAGECGSCWRTGIERRRSRLSSGDRA